MDFSAPGLADSPHPLADQVVEMLERVRPRRIWLRADLWHQLSDELCGPDAWIGSINGVPILLGNRRHGL